MKTAIYLYCSILYLHLSSAHAQTFESSKGFIKNVGQIYNLKGQVNSDVLYLFRHSTRMNIQLRKNGYAYDIYSSTFKKDENSLNEHPNHKLTKRTTTTKFCRIEFEFLNPSAKIDIIETGVQSSKTRYLHPDRTIQPQLIDQITYLNIEEGIDLKFTGKGNTSYPFKYDLIVKPGKSLSDFGFRISGFDNIWIEQNELVIEVNDFILRESIPSSYILGSGKQLEIRYSLEKRDKEAILKFHIAEDDLYTTRIVDPVPTLIWSRYVGDSLPTVVNAVITDRFGNIYQCGTTWSLTNIASSGAYQQEISDSLSDAFVTKLNKGGFVEWSSYFGGPGNESAYDIYVDTALNVIFCGITDSDTLIADTSAFQASKSGLKDGFATSFDPDGNLRWSTYFGGELDDELVGLSVDFFGNIYIAGNTSSDSLFVSDSSYQSVKKEGTDALVLKLDKAGNYLWSTYIGGDSLDFATAIAFGDSAIYLSGLTISSDLHTDSSSHQQLYRGDFDGFLTRFDADGAFSWLTYLGGGEADVLNAVKVFNNNIYVVGWTASDSLVADTSAFQCIKSDSIDVLLGKFNHDGGLIWSSYLGGEGNDYGYDLAFELDSNLFISGFTTTDTLMATENNTFQAVRNGGTDAFISKFSRNGSIFWSSYYGGPNEDQCYGVDVFGNTAIYLVGETYSDTNIVNQSLETDWAQYHGSSDGFIAKFIQQKSTLPNFGTGGSCIVDSTGTYVGPGTSNNSNCGICPGTKITLTTAGGDLGSDAIWVWYQGACGEFGTQVATGDTLVVYPQFSTTYYLRAESITNVTECVDIRINVCPFPATPNITSTHLGCAGSTFSFNGDGNGTITWVTPDELYFQTDTLLINNLSLSNSGTYVYTVVDSNNCANSDTIEFNVLTQPQGLIQSIDESCYHTNNGQIIYTNADTNAYSMLLNNQLVDDNILTSLVPNEYIFSIVNEAGCSFDTLITILPKPSVLLDTIITASGCIVPTGIIQLIYDSDTTAYSLLYNGQTYHSNLLEGLNSDSISFEIIVNEFCREEHTIFVPNTNNLFVNIIDFKSESCPYDSSGYALANITGGIEPIEIEWFPIGGTDELATNLTADTYSIIVRDSSGCEANMEINLATPPELEYSYNLVQPDCGGSNGSIEILSDWEAVSSLLWSTSDTFPSINNLIQNNYSVNIIDTSGCKYELNISLQALNNLEITLPETVYLAYGDSVLLSPELNLVGSFSYSWNPSEYLSCDSCLTTYALPIDTAVYSIRVSHIDGCSDSASIAVVIRNPCVEMFVPDIFSPNGDELNDFWCIIGTCFEILSAQVFNQWGELLYEGFSQDDCWDGFHQGELVQQGTYIYKIKMQILPGEIEVISGSISVVY